MNSRIKHIFNQSMKINNIFPLYFQNKQIGKILNNGNISLNLSGITNENSTTDSDFSFKNNVSNITNAHPKDSEKEISLKNKDKFINELFKAYSEENCICNYLLFQKNINININLNKKSSKNITLSDYFDLFNNSSFLGLKIPFLEKNGNIKYNTFNPTLSSMVLEVKSKKIIDEKTYSYYIKKNFSIYSLHEKFIRIEFDETNPPYYREIIDTKIKIIHQIIGKKRISLDDVIKDKSYFCILWTPADTYNINSSFLSFYNFTFKLIGSLIIKRNDSIWLSSFSRENSNSKDFKKDYLNNVSIIEKFINNNCNQNFNNNKDKNIFSNDYKRYIYSS